MKSVASERLQEVLDYWRDACWYYEAVTRTISKYEPLTPDEIPVHVSNWRRYTDLVFNNEVKELDLNDWVPYAEESKNAPELSALATFPVEFFEWSRKSRRVFHLPQNITSLFVQAPFTNIRWKDVLWPFDSFAITLDAPLVVEDVPGTWSRYDTILVAKIPKLDMITIRLLRESHCAKEECRIPTRAKERFDVLYRHGNVGKIRRLLDREWAGIKERMKSTPGWRWAVLCDRPSPDAKVALEASDFAKLIPQQELKKLVDEGGLDANLWRVEPTSWAAKIVVGWCVYRRSLKPTSQVWSEYRVPPAKRGTRGVTGVITQPENVCTILGEGRLDPTTYGLREPPEQSSGFFKRPHWRSAHDRRTRGGETVEIPPLLIRKDLVPLYGIIGGTKTEVLDEE